MHGQWPGPCTPTWARPIELLNMSPGTNQINRASYADHTRINLTLGLEPRELAPMPIEMDPPSTRTQRALVTTEPPTHTRPHARTLS
jgi:hypothetical protein